MQMPLKLIIDDQRIRKDGTCSVYIQYCYSPSKRTLLNTQIELLPTHWNKKLGCISNNLSDKYGDAEELNMELKRQLRIAEEIVFFANKKKLSDPILFLKENFKTDFDVNRLHEIAKQIDKQNHKLNLDLYFQIDDYIQSKAKKVCKDMPRIYRNMKYHLQAFETFRGMPIRFVNLLKMILLK